MEGGGGGGVLQWGLSVGPDLGIIFHWTPETNFPKHFSQENSMLEGEGGGAVNDWI